MSDPAKIVDAIIEVVVEFAMGLTGFSYRKDMLMNEISDCHGRTASAS